MNALILLVLLAVLSGCSRAHPSLSENAMDVSDEQVAVYSKDGDRKFQRVDEKATVGRDRKECSAWTYDEKQVQVDLAKMRPVSQEEWGRTCYQYSCSLQGAVEIEGGEGKLTVNAGGWMSLTSNEHTQFFVSDEQLPIFLAWCNCCE